MGMLGSDGSVRFSEMLMAGSDGSPGRAKSRLKMGMLGSDGSVRLMLMVGSPGKPGKSKSREKLGMLGSDGSVSVKLGSEMVGSAKLQSDTPYAPANTPALGSPTAPVSPSPTGVSPDNSGATGVRPPSTTVPKTDAIPSLI